MSEKKPNMDEQKILVVDDEPLLIELIVKVLEKQGYNLYAANNGQRALEVAQKSMPDLVILDWDMPVMNGLEAVRAFKNDHQLKHIPIIMITGRMSSTESLKLAFDEGVVDFINKPFNQIELVARVKSVLLLAHYIKEVVRSKDWELTLMARSVHQKDDMIKRVIELIEENCDLDAVSKKENHRSLMQEIQNFKVAYSSNSWDIFEEYFKKVHPNFNKNLLLSFPKLTAEDLRLSYFLRLNMSSKEIAAITNKESSSIDVARYRLRKKLKLSKEVKLHEFLSNF